MGGTSFLYRAVREGAHVRVVVFAGPDVEHRAHCGTLIFREREWHDFQWRVEGRGHEVEGAPMRAVDTALDRLDERIEDYEIRDDRENPG